jgi:3-hydroxybutyryl-CoA dehydrogenase
MSIASVAIIGGGTMGTGIAYVCALAGAAVTVAEPDEDRAGALQLALERAVASGVSRGKLDAASGSALLARIRRVGAIEEIPDGLDLAIETVSERLDLKLDVLARIGRRGARLIASNTSAMSIDRLASAVPDATRFLGMHFFNPVWSIRLVEIVLGTHTSSDTLAQTRAFVSTLGKESLVVRDVPGFATSRLDLAASLEAMRMLESGVASAEDIDRAATLAYHHPVGPLRLSDIVGLDVRLDIARTLEQAHGARFAPPAILIEKVARGELGQKSGQGFFSWAD